MGDAPSDPPDVGHGCLWCSSLYRALRRIWPDLDLRAALRLLAAETSWRVTRVRLFRVPSRFERRRVMVRGHVLSRASMSEHSRIIAFVLLAIAGFAPYMGVNGVLVRYLFPYASLVLGARLVGRSLVSSSFSGTLVAALTALLLMAGNILLSPEIGVAFAIAWTTYAALNLGREPRLALISLIALILAGFLSWLLLPREYYGTFLRFSEGANNLPLLPAPHLILYILGLFLVIPPLLAASVRKWPKEEVAGVALCGALAVLCIVMAPGALGRCDPPHVLLYGMGASMLLMIQLSRISSRAFTAYAIAYAAVFIVFIEGVNLVVFYGISPQTLLSQHPMRNVIDKLHSAKGTTHPDGATLSALDRFPRIGLPFASFGDPVLERYVMDRGQLQPEYDVSVVGVYIHRRWSESCATLPRWNMFLFRRG